MGTVWCCSVETLYPHLLSINVKAAVYTTVISPLLLYGCAGLSLTEEYELRVSRTAEQRMTFKLKEKY
jgi:hypothetical protein